MGQKDSQLKVNSSVCVQGGSGAVDGVTLCCGRQPGCCGGRGRRLIAAFTFPREEWQVAHDGFQRNTSAQAAIVKMGRLSKKDGNTPVRVTCLAAGSPVATQEMRLADLLQGLRLTKIEDHAVLFLSLGGCAGAGQAFTVVFCNGRRLGGGEVKVDSPYLVDNGPGQETGCEGAPEQCDGGSLGDEKKVEYFPVLADCWNIDSSEDESDTDSDFYSALEDDWDAKIEYFPDLADCWNIDSSEDESDNDSDFYSALEDDWDAKIEYFPDLADCWNIDSSEDESVTSDEYYSASENDSETDDEYHSGRDDSYNSDNESSSPLDYYDSDDDLCASEDSPGSEAVPDAWDMASEWPPMDEEDHDFWDIVGDCASVVTALLVLYQAWMYLHL